MRRRWVLRGMFGGAIGAALVSTGCSVLPSQPFLQRRDWPLSVTRPTSLPPRRNGEVLLVRTMQAAPGLESRGLRVLRDDGSLQTRVYEQWAVPPSESVDDDLRRWLDVSGLFAAVVPAGSRLQADLVLESELTALHVDLRAGTAQATLSIVLIDQRPVPARILLQRTETATVKLDGTDAPSEVRAQTAALEAVLRQTEAALGAAIGR